MTNDNDLIRRGDALTAVGRNVLGSNAALAAIRAVQPAAPSANAVTIKPLVWEEDTDPDSDDFRAFVARSPTLHLRYIVRKVYGGFWKLTGCVPFGTPNFLTLNDAKAAAQTDYEGRILAALETTPDPRDEVIARLVEENNWQIKARAQHWLRRTISAPEDAAVEEICEKYGYGAVMDAASRLWARKPYGSGAFYVGGCIGFKSDDEARAALAAAKTLTKETKE